MLFILSISYGHNLNNESLPKGFDKNEINRVHEIYLMRRDTPPPIHPIRNIAEFERMQGALVRYPFGVSTEIIAEMSEDIIIYCLIDSSDQGLAFSMMENEGLDMRNIEFIYADTDSYWTRDYGPWWIVNGQNEVSIVDFTYNRPRVNDNLVPFKISQYFDVPYFATDIIHAGGNYMTDGYGISMSSNLVMEENNLSYDSLLQIMSNYFGIDAYHLLDDPNNNYINHIDCWAKILSPTDILIRSVPPNHDQFNEIEEVVQYFENIVNNWGKPWSVHRIWTPNDEPYTNSLILNGKVFVPLMGNDWDDDALDTYQSVMNGYEVIGFTGSWESTDALHCRIKGIPDLNLLQIFHEPIDDFTQESISGFDVNVKIDNLNGIGLIEDSSRIFWKIESEMSWNVTVMQTVGINENVNFQKGWIPGVSDTVLVNYFISITDSSGKNEKNPLVGYHEFIGIPYDICNEWIIGDLDNSGYLGIIDLLLLLDQTVYQINFGNCVNSVSDINGDGAIDMMDFFELKEKILNP